MKETRRGGGGSTRVVLRIRQKWFVEKGNASKAGKVKEEEHDDEDEDEKKDEDELDQRLKIN